MPSFNAMTRRSTPEIVLPSKNLNSSSKVANWIIVDFLKYFKGGVPPRPRKKNSGLLTQKLLAASNGELYTAM